MSFLSCFAKKNLFLSGFLTMSNGYILRHLENSKNYSKEIQSILKLNFLTLNIHHVLNTLTFTQAFELKRIYQEKFCKNVITLAVTNRWKLGSMGTSNLFKMKK